MGVWSQTDKIAIQFKQTSNLTWKPMWRLTHTFGKGSQIFRDINEEEEEGDLGCFLF